LPNEKPVIASVDHLASLDGLTFKVATPVERLRAAELQRQVYAEDVGHVPSDSFDARAHHLVVINEAEEVVAAFRIVGPEQRPFDIEQHLDLATILSGHRRPGLIGRLCIRRDYRSVSRHMMLPFGVLKLAYGFSRQRGITDLLLYTYPNLVTFYRGAFFRLIEPPIEHPAWGRVHVMHLDLVELYDRLTHSYQPLARFLCQSDLPNFLL
jgi:predicted GNAT family N-acyltransferase